jgi:universal stress protein A
MKIKQLASNQNRHASSRRSFARPALVQNANTRTRPLTLKRILVPLDFSGKSRPALEYAIPLAEAFGGRIRLLHVVQVVPTLGVSTPGGEMSFIAMDEQPHVERATVHWRELAKHLLPPALADKLVVRVGLPYDEIVQAAADMHADLMVITTHGHTGIKHALLGSTAERIIRHAPCPVLTVRRRG